MKETEEEVITVLTTEILSEVPESSKENVVFLTEQLKPADLAKFNPLVVALNHLKKLKNIKYDPKDKATIQAFKDAKKDIGAFNTSVKSTKTVLKADYLKITRGLDTIQNTFLEESRNIKDELFKNFDVYLKAEEANKKAKEDKKDAARNAELLKLKEDHAIQELQVDGQNAYNKIKYDIISAAKNVSISNLNALSLDSVKRQIQNFIDLTYDREIIGHFEVGQARHDKLSKEQADELKILFADTYAQTIKLYKERRDELQVVEDGRLKSEREKGQLEGFERVKPQEDIKDMKPLGFENQTGITSMDVAANKARNPINVDMEKAGEAIMRPEGPVVPDKTTFHRESSGPDDGRNLSPSEIAEAFKVQPSGPPSPPPSNKETIKDLIDALRNIRDVHCDDLREGLKNNDNALEIVLNIQSMLDKLINYVQPKFDKL